MGSLMPGWDGGSLGIPPKELQDIDEETEMPKIGYFERLEKSKSLRRSSLGHPGETHQAHEALLKRSATERRSAELHHGAHRKLEHSATTAPAKYHATDWESELLGLQRKSVGSTPMSSSASSARGASGPGSPPAWWAQMDTGALNSALAPETSDAAGKERHNSVKLDFGLTGTNLH